MFEVWISFLFFEMSVLFEILVLFLYFVSGFGMGVFRSLVSFFGVVICFLGNSNDFRL